MPVKLSSYPLIVHNHNHPQPLPEDNQDNFITRVEKEIIVCGLNIVAL